DKEKTYEFLVEHGFDTPQIFTYSRARKGPFPLFMKPRHGSSAKDIHFLRSRSALEFYRRSSGENVIQEFISGEEFTIDVFADSSGKARCAVPRKRLEVRGGEVSKSLTVRHEEIIAQSMRLVDELKGCFGAITIQCFLTPEGQIKFIEINPRFGGGIPLAFRAGANYPKWLLQMQLGREPDFDAGVWQDGLFMLRYDESIFKTQDEVQG
ncbi:MAG: ATP-grasp domain-containing protein, partial [Phycisphaerae bacterium]|nr:ATP-grasp domain-containing protein [Phycisphaerae bacterium]